MSNDKKEITLSDTLKSMDTEEFIDLKFYRPLGFAWAKFFARVGIHPNTVTIISFFLGIGAGILFYFPDLWLNIIGMLLLVWANTYDSADGQLARMTRQYTKLGRMLDGFAGDLWFATIYLALYFRLMHFFGWEWWIILIIAFIGYCHACQASMADYYRNIHLYFLKGEAGSDYDHSAQLYALYKSLSWKKTPFDKFAQFVYYRHTAGQERFSPSMQVFDRTLKEHYGTQMPPQSLRDDFRAASLPLMKYTNILSFNTRVIVLFISLLIGLPWIYFIFELSILNILLLYLVYRHERLCRNFTTRIKNGDYEY